MKVKQQFLAALLVAMLGVLAVPWHANAGDAGSRKHWCAAELCKQQGYAGDELEKCALATVGEMADPCAMLFARTDDVVNVSNKQDCGERRCRRRRHRTQVVVHEDQWRRPAVIGPTLVIGAPLYAPCW